MGLSALFLRVPALVIMTLQWGAVGAASVAVLAPVAQLLLAVPLLQRKLMSPAQQRSWYLQDLGWPALIATSTALALRALPAPAPQWPLLAFMAAVIGAVYAGTALATPASRQWLLDRYAEFAR